MPKLKTQDIILDIALILFNDKGEHSVTSVDIAYETNISPGNLYYHFKGKEEIVEELYARFHASLSIITQQVAKTKKIDTTGILAYLHLIADIFEQYKFISQNSASLCDIYPSIRQPFKKLLNQLRNQIADYASRLPSTPTHLKKSATFMLLADNLLTTLMSFENFATMIDGQNSTQTRESKRASLVTHLNIQLLPFL